MLASQWRLRCIRTVVVTYLRDLGLSFESIRRSSIYVKAWISLLYVGVEGFVQLNVYDECVFWNFELRLMRDMTDWSLRPMPTPKWTTTLTWLTLLVVTNGEVSSSKHQCDLVQNNCSTRCVCQKWPFRKAQMQMDTREVSMETNSYTCIQFADNLPMVPRFFSTRPRECTLPVR